MRKSLILPSAGTGSRFDHTGKTKKQFTLLNQMPIMIHTLNLFLDIGSEIDSESSYIEDIILVVPAEDIEGSRDLLLMYNSSITNRVKIIAGGQTRQESVYKGLQALPDHSEYVLIHDVVRPFVSRESLLRLFQALNKYDAVLLGYPVADTLKLVSKSENSDNIILKTIDRSNIWIAQTPQAFKTELILEAHQRALSHNFIGTDDASLVEELGHKVHFVLGDSSNIKITLQSDLRLAQDICNSLSN